MEKTSRNDYILFIVLFSIAFISSFLFFSFSIKVNETLPWFNNADQNTWIIYYSLDFNQGFPINFYSNRGVGTYMLYGFALRILDWCNVIDISNSDQLKEFDDPFLIIKRLHMQGKIISCILIFKIALILSVSCRFLFKSNVIISTYCFICVLFSGGFLFHSAVMRNELSTVYYFSVSIFFFVLARIYAHKESNNYLITLFIISSGYFLGLSYFSKIQIIFPLIFLLFLFTINRERENFDKLVNNKIYLFAWIVNVVIILFLFENCRRDLTFFWLIVFTAIFAISIIPIISTIRVKIPLKWLGIINYLSLYSIGFMISIAYVFIWGLKGNADYFHELMQMTSYLDSSNNLIDTSFNRIFTRFFYCIQQYFIESPLIYSLFFLVFHLKERRKFGQVYILLFGVIILCFINSLRIMFLVNLGKSVYKYSVFTDVFVVLIISFTYHLFLKTYKSKRLIHTFYWCGLFLMMSNNYNKVDRNTNWDFTTYSYLLFNESAKINLDNVNGILRRKYSGFINGYDRLIFGDENKYIGKLEVPKWQLSRIQKKSREYYLKKVIEIKPDLKEKLSIINNIEDQLHQIKLKLFRNGYNYKEIRDLLLKERKKKYKKYFDEIDSKFFLESISNKKLTVPF